jgi:hypothetical protein
MTTERNIYDAFPEANTAEAVLRMLNRYERTTEGKPLTAADLLTQPEAVKAAAKHPEAYDLTGFHPAALFVSAVAAVDWLQGLTAEGFESALRDEVLTGWFLEQDYDSKALDNEDGSEPEFMSTPCIDCTEFDFEEVDTGIHDCSRGGLLLLSPYMRRA